jgi:hypothetical protein
MSSSGFGNFANSSSLNSASMWKNAIRAILSDRFSDHDIALLQSDFTVVEHQDDLAFDHDDVV